MRSENSKTGYRGVVIVKGSYYARIKINGKVKSLGAHPDALADSLAYDKAYKEIEHERREKRKAIGKKLIGKKYKFRTHTNVQRLCFNSVNTRYAQRASLIPDNYIGF